jgi:hypothetical protein
MPYYQFGVGFLFASPKGGNLPAPTYPQFIGTIQNADVEFSRTNKELRGQNQLPDDVAPGDEKITFKSEFGRIDVDVYNNVMFGETIATGVTAFSNIEQHSVPANTPYTVTITPPNTGVFAADYGVMYLNGLVPLKAVGTAPAAVGTYEVNLATGVYTFYSGDASAQVVISYSYTLTTGRTLTHINHLQGYGPYFELLLGMPYQGTNMLRLRRCRCSKTGAPLKRSDYMLSAFEGDAYPDATGAAFDWYEVP